MKKLIISLALVTTILFTLVSSFAEIDLSSLSLEEMLKLQEELAAAIENAQQEVGAEDTETEETVTEESQVEPAPALDTSSYTELSKGSKGDEVIALQTRLQDLGFYSSKVDGDYGNGTVTAIKAFEQYNGTSTFVM